MTMKIYGEEKSDSEIIDFVKNYVKAEMNYKNSRFHDILSLIPSGGKKVLDYGCGWGGMSIAMKEKGNYVEGIDLSQNEIDICNLVWQERENPKFSKKTVSEFSDNTFDVVNSNQVIEHVHNPGIFLSNINRILKPDGQLVISLPNIVNPRCMVMAMAKDMEKSLIEMSHKYATEYRKESHHINGWDQVHFTMLAASVGFVVEKYIASEGIPMPMMWPFKHYISINNRRLRNLCYTMVFCLKKVRYVNIRPED